MILEDFIIRMLIVVIIGFVIGIERQITGHSAGLTVLHCGLQPV